jgi:hypothetical protein
MGGLSVAINDLWKVPAAQSGMGKRLRSAAAPRTDCRVRPTLVGETVLPACRPGLVSRRVTALTPPIAPAFEPCGVLPN